MMTEMQKPPYGTDSSLHSMLDVFEHIYDEPIPKDPSSVSPETLRQIEEDLRECSGAHCSDYSKILGFPPPDYASISPETLQAIEDDLRDCRDKYCSWRTVNSGSLETDYRTASHKLDLFIERKK